MGPTEIQKYLKLINDSPYLDAAEKFTWTQLLPKMSPAQLLELENILSRPKANQKGVDPAYMGRGINTSDVQTALAPPPPVTKPAPTPAIDAAAPVTSPAPSTAKPPEAEKTPDTTVHPPVTAPTPTPTKTFSHLSNLPSSLKRDPKQPKPEEPPKTSAELIRPQTSPQEVKPKLPKKPDAPEPLWPRKHLVSQTDKVNAYRKLTDLDGLSRLTWEDFAAVGEGATIEAILNLRKHHGRMPVRVCFEVSPLYKDYRESGENVLNGKKSEKLTLAEFEEITDILRAL